MGAVFFDLDGTLCDTAADLSASVNYALRMFDFPARSEEEVRSMIGNGIPALCRRAMPESAASHFDLVVSLTIAHYRRNCTLRTRPYEGMSETVSTLSKQGHILAVLTNKEQQCTEKIISELFPDRGAAFSLVMGQSGRYAAKPDPEMLYAAAKELNVSLSDITFIGDSPVDAQFAANAGVRFVGCDWGYGSSRLCECSAETIISSPMELLSLSL